MKKKLKGYFYLQQQTSRNFFLLYESSDTRLAMNEMQTPWSMDQTKEKVIRNRFDILKRFLQQNKYHHTTLKLCSKQRSKQHLSTKRWLHICFDLRARYLFTVKDFTSGHSRNTNNKVSLHKFDCNIHSSSLDQSKEKVI